MNYIGTAECKPERWDFSATVQVIVGLLFHEGLPEISQIKFPHYGPRMVSVLYLDIEMCVKYFVRWLGIYLKLVNDSQGEFQLWNLSLVVLFVKHN